jgi:CheY-like chemotaxis protein
MSGNSSAILLIDPSDDSRALHADSLRRAGFRVVAVTDCDAGFKTLTTLTPQLIIASFNPLTRDECLAFCERLKTDAQTRAVPIFLTSHAINRDDLRRAMDTRVLVLSLASPLDDMKLTSAVRGVLAVGDGSLPPVNPNLPRSA